MREGQLGFEHGRQPHVEVADDVPAHPFSLNTDIPAVKVMIARSLAFGTRALSRPSKTDNLHDEQRTVSETE